MNLFPCLFVLRCVDDGSSEPCYVMLFFSKQREKW